VTLGPKAASASALPYTSRPKPWRVSSGRAASASPKAMVPAVTPCSQRNQKAGMGVTVS
jgi:hypothetical protein